MPTPTLSETRITETGFQAAIIGAGPAGLATACALAHVGTKTALLAAPHRPAGNRPDTRTAALFNGSLNFLDKLGAWETSRPRCARLAAIRLIDDTGSLLKAPDVLFEASEIAQSEFGYNIPQTILVDALRAAAAAMPNLTTIETEGVTDVSHGPDKALIRLSEGATITADIVAAADGRNSIGRRCAGIGVKIHGYEQAAVTCTFTHTRPHGDVSTEFHRKAGPLTVVPLPGDASSLVWVERPDVAKRLYDLTDEQFIDTLGRQLRGLLGALSDLSPRALFPLTAMTAETMARNRTILIGEAGHVMPPIGAQGLNLSFRDAATLAELAKAENESGRSLGSKAMLDAYNARRGIDVRSRTLMVDTLNRALTSDFLPVQLARGAGLHAIRAIAPLKTMMMREGMQPTVGVPEMMRP